MHCFSSFAALHADAWHQTHRTVYAMPKIALNDAALRSLPTPDVGQLDYWDTGLISFGVRVSQGGSKTFILNISNSRRAIGRYPVISLSEARGEAKRILAEKTLGKL